ncbi:hypothetical protein FVE85_9871 [Porphyridium purpureum]|uniref:Uncharacterized protein n=1 Tax=Porphyridium purpureum TaxID=35688 RepID=A0A5J4YHT0_PORPP|nr:hypothetical protein FVE85_9871 [Porphyridium purpureum]|eukprot:POR4115..scf289_17
MGCATHRRENEATAALGRQQRAAGSGGVQLDVQHACIYARACELVAGAAGTGRGGAPAHLREPRPSARRGMHVTIIGGSQSRYAPMSCNSLVRTARLEAKNASQEMLKRTSAQFQLAMAASQQLFGSAAYMPS